jgi:hypothetical protein
MKGINQLLFGFLIINFILSLGNCKSKNNVQDKVVEDFEKELMLLFNKDKTVNGNDYKNYLTGINEMTISREFFTSKEKVEKATEFRASDLFKSIWERKSIIDKERYQNKSEIIIEPPRTAGDDNNQTRLDYYQINPDSKFMNDLIEQAKNFEIKSLFKEIQKAGYLSPTIISKSLLEIDDFKDESVKKYIVLQFYFDFIFMMNRMNQIN